MASLLLTTVTRSDRSSALWHESKLLLRSQLRNNLARMPHLMVRRASEVGIINCYIHLQSEGA